MADINWAEIRLFYVTSENNLSFQQVADKFGISKSAVAGRHKSDNWEEEREKYRSRMIIKIQDTIITEKARRHRRRSGRVVRHELHRQGAPNPEAQGS